MLTTILVSAVLAQQQPEATERFPDFPAQDMLHYGLHLSVDIARKRISGIVNYEIRAVEALATLQLHAKKSDAWHPRFFGATKDGAELPTTWNDNETVTLTLPRRFEAGSTFGIQAVLEGTPVDGFYFKASRYGAPLAFTDHYSIRARGWLPCEDHPADRATWSTVVAYPEGTQCAGYGRRAVSSGVKPPEGFAIERFDSQVEIAPYMYSLVVGPYAHVEEAGDDRLVGHWVYPQDVERAKKALVHHAAWIGWMEQRFGEYPFSKYSTVQCPTRWGGFESPGVVLVAESLFDSDRGVGTLAHEVVHMWFGDAVGYSRWHEVWLSEGFASYFGPWLWSTTGGPELTDAMRSMRERWRKSFEGRTKTVRDDSFPHPDQALNSNTYPKGAWVLHMLRKEVGDTSFFKALRDYFQTFRGRSVVTRDFIDVVEESTGRELDWFFSQWLDRVDCPKLRVTIDDERVVIEQVQKGSLYRFPLLFAYEANGEDKRHRALITERKTVIHLDATVEAVELDPDVELLFRE